MLERLWRVVLDSTLFQVALLIWCLAIFAIYFGLAALPLLPPWLRSARARDADCRAHGRAGSGSRPCFNVTGFGAVPAARVRLLISTGRTSAIGTSRNPGKR